MKLSDGARPQGIRSLIAWRWFRAGPLPVPARQLPAGAIRVEEPNPKGRTALDARASSSDQKDNRRRPARRLPAFARDQGWTAFDRAAGIGSGLNGKRRKRRRALRDPRASRIGVEGRGRRARLGFERLEAALAATGQRGVVVEKGEGTDDLARDFLEILPPACGQRYGRRSARWQAPEAMGCG